MKKLLTTILTILSLTVHAESAAPPDGKMTLYYEDGSKKSVKEYKDGQPIGTWMVWYADGKVQNKAVFQVASSSEIKSKTGNFTSAIVDVEVRYQNKDNSIRFKGISFHLNKLTSQINGETVHYPTWTHMIRSYDEDGNVRKENKEEAFGIEDTLTGITYTMPWILE